MIEIGKRIQANSVIRVPLDKVPNNFYKFNLITVERAVHFDGPFAFRIQLRGTASLFHGVYTFKSLFMVTLVIFISDNPKNEIYKYKFVIEIPVLSDTVLQRLNIIFFYIPRFSEKKTNASS